jgi:DNA polymerase-3 subunit delta'
MRFGDIFGHDREIDALKRAIASNRLPHAYLFTGIDGIGKKLVAKALASAINCREPVDNDSCGSCVDCRAFEAGGHENLVVIGPDEKGYLKIDQVREVQRAQRFKVARGARMIIVDSADAMQAPAQNAFLKTLEEPVKGTMITLIASRPSALLPTMLSRCRRVNFAPLAEAELMRALVESEGVEPEKAGLLASYGAGSFSRAMAALRDGTCDSGAGYLERLLGLDPGDLEGALKLAYDLSKDDSLQGSLEFIKTWLRDESLKAVGAWDAVAGNRGMIGERDWYNGPRAVGFNALYALFKAIDAAQLNVAAPRNANKQLAMETLVMDFASTIGTAEGVLKHAW